jgi:hypothetical protein
MNNIFIKGTVLSVMLMTVVNANAQFNLTNLKNAVNNTASKMSGENAATTSTILGVWSYKQPVVVFNSDNLLKKAGGSVASTAIENKLQSKFSEMGIKAGKMIFTFVKDGSFTGVIADKKMIGKYKLSKATITLSYSNNGTQSISGTTRMVSGNLEVLFNTTKLLSFINMASGSTNDATIKSLMSLAGSYDGMLTGLRFSKK